MRDESLIERNGRLRSRRVDEARPPALRGVAVERELRDHEQLAADVGEREVHLVVGVREESEADDFVGHPRDTCFIVRMREADEKEKARGQCGPPVELHCLRGSAPRRGKPAAGERAWFREALIYVVQPR